MPNISKCQLAVKYCSFTYRYIFSQTHISLTFPSLMTQSQHLQMLFKVLYWYCMCIKWLLVFNCSENWFHRQTLKRSVLVWSGPLPLQLLLQLKRSVTRVLDVVTWQAGQTRVGRLHQRHSAGHRLHPHLTPRREIHRPMHPGQLLR